MEIRKAVMGDWEEIRKIYAEARLFMAEHGNGGQWGKTNPPEELLLEDMAQGRLYVCMDGEAIAAVFYFSAAEDPDYGVIEDGAWLNDEPYGVVHRIASARTTKGAASFCMEWAYQQTGNIRIDTHEDNIPMQNMLKKNGFRYCGRIHLKNGEPRIAFQKAGKNTIEIREFTKDRISDAVAFERNLRKEEDFYFWEIDDKYIAEVTGSFEDERFGNAISLLAYVEDKPVGRIDAVLLASRFDGGINAYLDWICVVKSYRHRGVAQKLMQDMRKRLKEKGARQLIGLMAANEESQKFYRSLEGTEIHDEGIWIKL